MPLPNRPDRTMGEAPGFFEMFRPTSPLERDLARRYLKSRRASGRLSLISGIAMGGVAIGVAALIVVLGVMNGLRNDLRERILIANPHLRILTYGNGLRLDDWRPILEQVKKEPGVVAAAPEVLSQTLLSAGADYVEGVNVLGFDPDTGTRAVTSLPQAITKGDLSFKTTRDDVDGAILLGSRLAERMTVYPGDVVTLVPAKPQPVNRALGVGVPRYWRFEISGTFQTGMFLYDNQFVVMSREVAQRFTGLGMPSAASKSGWPIPGRLRRSASGLKSNWAIPIALSTGSSRTRRCSARCSWKNWRWGSLSFLSWWLPRSTSWPP